MEWAQSRIKSVVIAEPLRSIDEYKNEVLQALLGSRTIKITASDDAVRMAICVAQLVESTKRAIKFFVDVWNNSSTFLDTYEHSQQIRIFMERIERQHPDPEDLGIVMNFADNDGDFMRDTNDAVAVLIERKRLILRGINEGVIRVIRVAQALIDAEEAVKKTIDISTDYRNHMTAKIEIEMKPRVTGFAYGTITAEELREVMASNSWKRGQRAVFRAPLYSYSKTLYSDRKLYSTSKPLHSDRKQQLTVKNTEDVGSPGASSSSGSQKRCNAPSIGKRKGGVGIPLPSSSNTKKQCEVPPIDKSTENVESTGVSSSDAEKQNKAPSIDKSKGNDESPGASSTDNKKQCD